MAGKLKTEELEHNGAAPLCDYFLGLLGRFGSFFFFFFDCHVTFCLEAIHFADIEFLLSTIFIP